MQIKGCEDIVSTLRNGSAAVNAVALMKGKGFSLSRRSRHRLTPGTVKFAVFHVLSLEGSKGLTILELADKIQVVIVSAFFKKISFLLFCSSLILFIFFLLARNLDFEI